jgi:hypothetical protein
VIFALGDGQADFDESFEFGLGLLRFADDSGELDGTDHRAGGEERDASIGPRPLVAALQENA